MKGYIWITAAAVVLGVMVIWAILDPLGAGGECPPDCPPTPETITPPPPPPDKLIKISMASSITKWEWLEAAAEAFNVASKTDSNLQVNDRPIEVEILLENDPLTGKPRHWNSPTQVAATLKEEIKPTILSPATSIWLLKLNKGWRNQYGTEITSVPAPSLLRTPVVIAMFQPGKE